MEVNCKFLDVKKVKNVIDYMNAEDWNSSWNEFVKYSSAEERIHNFYYKVKLDYPTQTFEVFNHPNGNRVGTVSSPIKWYEYVNPS